MNQLDIDQGIVIFGVSEWLVFDSALRLTEQFILGTVREQMIVNGGGRSPPHADETVRIFNWLILISALLTPLFGYILDK